MTPAHYRSGHLWVAKCTRAVDGSWIDPQNLPAGGENPDDERFRSPRGQHEHSGWRVRWVSLRGERAQLAICNHRRHKARHVLDLTRDGCYVGELTDDEAQILRAGERAPSSARPIIRAAKGLFQSASRYRLLNDEYLAPFPFKVTAWCPTTGARVTYFFSARNADAKLQWLAVIQSAVCSATHAAMESRARGGPSAVTSASSTPSHAAGEPRTTRSADASRIQPLDPAACGECLIRPSSLSHPVASNSFQSRDGDAADAPLGPGEVDREAQGYAWVDSRGPEAAGDMGNAGDAYDPTAPDGLDGSAHGGFSTPRGGQDEPSGFLTPPSGAHRHSPSAHSSSPTPRSVSPSASSSGGDGQFSRSSFPGLERSSTDASNSFVYRHRRPRVGPPQEHLPVSRLEHGVRVLEETLVHGVFRLKASTVVHCHADVLFGVITDTDALPLVDPAVQHCRVVEELDAHTRVLHITYHAPGVATSLLASPTPSLVQRCMAMAPASCLQPRDLCLARTWRQEPDGGYLLVFESVAHRDCPRVPGYVRASVTNGMYTVMPPAGAHSAAMCLIHFHLELDPGYSSASLTYLQTCGLLGPCLEVHVAHVGALRAAAESSLFHPQGEIEMERSALMEQLQVVTGAGRGKERQTPAAAAVGPKPPVGAAPEGGQVAPDAHAAAPMPPVKSAPKAERPAHFGGGGMILRAASASIAMLASGVAHVASPRATQPPGAKPCVAGDGGGSSMEELARVKGARRALGGLGGAKAVAQPCGAKPSRASQNPTGDTEGKERERAWGGSGAGEQKGLDSGGGIVAEDREEAEEERLWEWASSFGTVPRRYWAPVTDAAGLVKVRGKSYLKDKVKVVSGHPIMHAWAVDLFLTDAPLMHVAERADSALAKMRAAVTAGDAVGDGHTSVTSNSSEAPSREGPARGGAKEAADEPSGVPEEGGQEAVRSPVGIDEKGQWTRAQNGSDSGAMHAGAGKANGMNGTHDQPALPSKKPPPACRPGYGSFRKGSAAWRSLEALRSGYVLMINAIFPAPGGRCFNLVIYACPWREGGWLTLDELGQRKEPHLRLLRRMVEPKAGPERTRLLKKIVYIHRAPAVVLWTFGRMLVAMSKKLGQLDFEVGDGCIAAYLDVRKGCLSSALNKVGVPYMSACVFDLVVVIEGQTEDELPENMLGGIKLININFAEQAMELPS